MLRVILLLDSLTVSAWTWESISQILREKNAQIILAVLNQSPKSSGEKSPFFYRVYRAMDRWIFLNQPDAFAKKALNTIPGWNIPVLQVQPIQKKYSDYLMPETLNEIRSYHPDIIIRFGFRILRGEILNLAPLGIWSFHHGDNQRYRGGPPCFWEVMNQEDTTGVVLQQLQEKLDDGLILYKSLAQTDPLSVQRNANKIFWLSAFIIPRVIRQIEVMGIEKWKENIKQNQSCSSDKIPILTPPGFALMLANWVNLWSRNISRKLKESYKKPYWELLVAPNTAQTSIINQKINFKSISPPIGKLPKGSFWADPFPIEKDGKIWVFFEEFDGKTQKGKIGLGEWNAQELVSTRIILEEDWHVSYPFIWEENGSFYMIPESGEAGKTYLYKATDFPFRWERSGILLEEEAYDPTLWKSGDQYWFFVNQRPHPGTSAFVELYAYFSLSLENPIWTPHALNPIVSDVRASRPAGRIFQQNGKLYRPAQDSGKRYGHRVKIQEILKLTDTEFEEKTVRIFEPDEINGTLGTHTFNFTPNWIFSDSYSRK